MTAGDATAGTSVAIMGATRSADDGNTLFGDVSREFMQRCVSASVSGTVRVGRSTGGEVGQLSGPALKMNNCLFTPGVPLVMTGKGTWPVTAISVSSAGATVSVTKVQISAVMGPQNCSYTVSGSAMATYTNSTQLLSFDPHRSSLVISNVYHGCYGAIVNGDTAGFSMTLKLAASPTSDNPVAISAG